MIRRITNFLSSIEHAIEISADHSKGIVRRIAIMVTLAFLALGGLSFIHPEPVVTSNGLSISHPWSKGGNISLQTLPVYLMIENKNDLADQLVRVESSASVDATITMMTKESGRLQSRRMELLDIPPRKRVVLGPDLLEITLLSVKNAVQPGALIPVSLVFARAGKLDVKVRIEDLSEPAHADHF